MSYCSCKIHTKLTSKSTRSINLLNKFRLFPSSYCLPTVPFIELWNFVFNWIFKLNQLNKPQTLCVYLPNAHKDKQSVIISRNIGLWLWDRSHMTSTTQEGSGFCDKHGNFFNFRGKFCDSEVDEKVQIFADVISERPQ